LRFGFSVAAYLVLAFLVAIVQSLASWLWAELCSAKQIEATSQFPAKKARPCRA
jgi:hypothetical protein